MSTLGRLVVCVGVAAAAAGLLGVLLPTLGGPSLYGEALEACAAYCRELVRGEALATRDAAVLQSIEGKCEIARDLAEGRLTIDEAIGRFRRLRALLDDGQDEVLGAYRDYPRDEAGLGRHVLGWVEVHLRNDPRRDALLDRLEKELAARGKGVRAH